MVDNLSNKEAKACLKMLIEIERKEFAFVCALMRVVQQRRAFDDRELVAARRHEREINDRLADFGEKYVLLKEQVNG